MRNLDAVSMVAATVLFLLAGCAQQAPRQQADGPDAWVDCYFNDRSVGHIQRKDCVAAGGLARQPKIGPTVTYRVKVDWVGYDGPVYGTMMAPEYGLAGSFSVVLDSIDQRCAGQFRFTKSPRGVWSFDCEDGRVASGTLYQYGPKQAVVGNGKDSNGNEIDFEARPASPGP